MEKDFIPYQLALRMKALQFDYDCFAFYQIEYHEDTPIMVDDDSQYRVSGLRTCKNSEIPEHYVASPLYQQAFRWFRDNYNLYHNIDKHGYWFFEIKKDEGFGDLTEVISVYDFDRYEEAELQCLIKLIEVVEKWN